MKLDANQFPYPVLHPDLDDYMDNEAFRVKVYTSYTGNQVLFNVDFSVKNKDIRDRINNRDFVFAFHIEGESSSYRRLFCLEKEDTLQFAISKDEVRERYYAYGLILANRTLHQVTNSDFNSLYYGPSYCIGEMKKGEIVALSRKYDIKVNTEDVQTSESIFRIRRGSSTDNYVKVDLDSEYIIITLPQRLYEKYNQVNTLNEISRDPINQFIFLPVMVYVIEALRQEERSKEMDYSYAVKEGRPNWRASISQHLPPGQLESDKSSLELAQELLLMPYSKVVDYFNRENANDE